MEADRSRSSRLAAALRAKRTELIAALRDGKQSGKPRENRFGDETSKFDERIGNWIDLLAGYLEGRAGYDALLASQILIEVHRPEQNSAANRRALLASLDAAWADISNEMDLDELDYARLKCAFDDVSLGIRTEPVTHVKTLLLGDCLMGEVGGLAANALARHGISFDAFPLNARSPADLDRQVSRLEEQDLDAVFFSPFSHARLPELEALLDPHRATQSRAKIDEIVEVVIAQTEALLIYLLQRFDCPIYVHNAGLIARATTTLKGIVRNTLTARVRNRARKHINGWLGGFAAAQNATGRNRLQIIDEAKLVSSLGNRAGHYLYASDFQHATRLSLALADEYTDRIEMLATLWGKKLVICDLDHTLWNGVIGEGRVEHFSDRQASLVKLKQKSGVVLSIASKNDLSKIDFSGGLLALDDFVAPQINWGAKTASVRKLREQLNLQYRHMVFIDDRPDERAFVADAHPEVLVLDATDKSSWARLAYWADIAAGSSDLDRTKLYQQQVRRDDFVAETKVSTLTSEVIAKLDLQIDVREAGRARTERFVELINRTNQWNLTGSRTSVAAAREQCEADDSLVLLASARDKFGDMGDVCAASVAIAGDEATITAFVLSCRVFGYGVETAMLDTIRDMAFDRGASRLRGRFVATTQNRMAGDMYSDHGFEAKQDGWFETSLVGPTSSGATIGQ